MPISCLPCDSKAVRDLIFSIPMHVLVFLSNSNAQCYLLQDSGSLTALVLETQNISPQTLNTIVNLMEKDCRCVAGVHLEQELCNIETVLLRPKAHL